MIRRVVVHTTIPFAVIGAALLLAGGYWGWVQAWIWLAVQGFGSVAISSWLLRYDPALLESRTAMLWHHDQMRWDRFFIIAMVGVFLGWVVLIGLDAGRFRWSEVPIALEVVGCVLTVLGLAVAWQVFRFNSFAAPQVRVQVKRAHRVVSEGPYRIVRHPMYAGMILWLIGSPLMLGCWWGLAVVPLMIVGMGWRAVGEERMLRQELEGYDEYAQRVRWRLMPGIW